MEIDVAYLNRILKRINDLEDTMLSYKKLFEDVLYNLDADNIPSLTLIHQEISDDGQKLALIAQWQDSTNSALASIQIQTNQNGAKITSLTQWRGETNSTLSSIQQTSNAQGSTLTSLTQWKDSTVTPTLTSQTNTIASIQQQANQNGSKISLVVGANKVVNDVSGSVNASIVMTAINNDSSAIKISADKVNITGYVTFADLSTGGRSTINGSNITTGTISTSQLMKNSNGWIEFGSNISMGMNGIDFGSQVGIYPDPTYQAINISGGVNISGSPVLTAANIGNYNITAKFG